MAKEKVTLTLDASRLAELRRLAGARSLSATIDAAIAAHVDRLRRETALDRWMAELEETDGPIDARTQAWARDVFAQLREPKKHGRRRRAG